MRSIFALILPVLIPALLYGQACTIKNTAFKSGETITYKIYYNWGMIWMAAGEVTFKAELGEFKGKPAWHFSGTGGTYEKYDWFYKVRDKFESYADTASLKPFRFVRDQNEGSTSIYEECLFSFKKKKAYSVIRKDKKTKLDSVSITDCTIDVMTAIYYARCLDFSSYKVKDTIPMSLYLENQVYPIYIRYMGKEVHDLEGFGKFNCIKFRPKLIEGTIFKGGEDMTVWVTDDKNRLPLYVETPIVVGKIKVYLTKFSGLRHPFASKIK
ncbi:MAG: DUF3108 domain-containing protein [Bacteroidota bacterium]